LPIATDGVARGLFVSVSHDREPCKHGWIDRDVVWVVDSGGPTRGSRRGIFTGKRGDPL